MEDKDYTMPAVREAGRMRKKNQSPLIVKKSTSSLPHVPTALYTRELFEKSDEVVNHLKYNKTAKGTNIIHLHD